MSGAQPLVSIVIPVYNAEQYLSRAVESVLAQTVSDWELILVDDGSTDGSGAVCDEYAARDERISCLHTENGGSSAARNAGMAQARGEWLLFVDSDDWMEADALEKLLAHSQGADVVVGHFPGQRAPWRTVDAPKCFELAEITQEELTELFYLRMFHSPINKLYRCKGIVVPFRTDVSYIDDVTFLIANFAHWQRVVFVPDDTYCYAQRPDSLTHAFRIDRMEQVRESLRLFGGMFPDGSPVMETLSRWYVIELRLYLMYYAGQKSLPKDVRRLMIQLWLGDDSFDHGRISTALLNDDLQEFWDAVLRRDMEMLLKLLDNG